MATHISAFFLLFPIGVRRLLSAYSHHLRLTTFPHAHYYVAKPWYFAGSESTSAVAPTGRRQHQHQDQHNQQQQQLLHLLKDIDLYALLVALPIAAFSELFLFLTLAPPMQRLPFSHQSAALALFWLLLLAISLRYCLQASASFPDDVAFALAALAFLVELFLTGWGGGTGPIEGRIYGLLSLLTLSCAAACMVLAAHRSAFAADVALSAALAFKGTWVLQAGWCLFGVPPKGCHRSAVGTAAAGLVCELDEDQLRGVALVDLLFAVHAVGIAGGCLALLWAVARRANRAAAGETESSSSAMMRPMIPPELEMDY